MKTILNYSHPLSPETLAQVAAALGDGVQQNMVVCQLDMDAPIRPQLDALVSAGRRGHFDLLVPPALSFAAAYVTAALSYETMPSLVVLRRSISPLGGYELAEIL